jgi:hypothetical protein
MLVSPAIKMAVFTRFLGCDVNTFKKLLVNLLAVTNQFTLRSLGVFNTCMSNLFGTCIQALPMAATGKSSNVAAIAGNAVILPKKRC